MPMILRRLASCELIRGIEKAFQKQESQNLPEGRLDMAPPKLLPMNR